MYPLELVLQFYQLIAIKEIREGVEAISVFGKYSLLFIVGFWVLFTLFALLNKQYGPFWHKVFLHLLFAMVSFATFYGLIRIGVELENFKGYIIIAPLVFYGLFVLLPLVQPDTDSKQGREKVSSKPGSGKYEKTGLSRSYSLELKNRLLEIMEVEKVYLDPELRLDHIAKMLHISRHHASQVINENFDMGFNDFINAHRIDEAKKRLLSGFENSPETMSDIAYSCGFNNRASFYREFKKKTNRTPKEFIIEAEEQSVPYN